MNRTGKISSYLSQISSIETMMLRSRLFQSMFIPILLFGQCWLGIVSAQQPSSYSVVFVFATKDENTTCEAINGRLHSLSNAALREAEFNLAGNWQYYTGEWADELFPEEYNPDFVEEEFNHAQNGERRLARCFKGDCYEGCMYYNWPRHCACCSCCHGQL